MNLYRRLFAAAAFAALAPLSAHAQDLKEIRISSQPALLGSVPFTLAEEKGWWKELEPTFAETTEIVLGHVDHPVVSMTAHDWIQKAGPPWNQRQIPVEIR